MSRGEKVDKDGFIRVERRQWRRKELQAVVKERTELVVHDLSNIASVSGEKKDEGTQTNDKRIQQEAEPLKNVEHATNGSKASLEEPSGSEGNMEGNFVTSMPQNESNGAHCKTGGETKTPAPLFASVKRAFLPRRGAPVSNRFASLSCDESSDDDVDDNINMEDAWNIEGEMGGVKGPRDGKGVIIN